jgi:hypothetical protein
MFRRKRGYHRTGSTGYLFPGVNGGKRNCDVGPGTDFRIRADRIVDRPAQSLSVTGDFDADGTTDRVVAHRGAPGAQFLRGNGKGELAIAETLAPDVPSPPLAAADVNRSDGLADLLVAVTGPSGPALLIFESPDGAIRAMPEEIPLPARRVFHHCSASHG